MLTILAVALSVGFLLWSLRNREIRHAQLETASLTRMMMEQTEQNFESTDLVLQGVQERLNTAFGRQLELGSGPVHLLLTARAAGTRQASSMFIVNAEGKLANSSLEIPLRQLDLSDRDYFKVFANGGRDAMFISRPVRNRIDKAWTLYLARPLISADGEFRGVVAVAINIAAFEQMYSMVQLDYVRPLAIYLADGTLVASLPHRESLIGEVATELTREILPSVANEVRSIRHLSGDGGHEAFAIGRLAGYPVLLSVMDDESLSLASWRETAVPIGLGAALLCIFTGLVAVYLIGKLQNKEALTQALNAADQRYQHTVNSVMDAIVAVDKSMRIVMFNPSAETMFGRREADVLGTHLDTLIPERLRSRHEQQVNDFIDSVPDTGSLAPQSEVFGLRADGTEFPVETTISHSVIGGELQLTAVLRDVTDRRKVESELRKVNAQLRELSASLQQVREEERTRISRELHDDLGQQLTGLKLSLSWLGARIRDGKALEVAQVDEMRHQLDQAIGSVRRIAAELRPRLLDDLEFGEALAWQIKDFVKHSSLQVSVNLEAADLVTEEAIATALFRIVQEAMTNVVRHSGATQVSVDLVQSDGRLRLTIQDNGHGFEAERRSGGGGVGVGVVGMRERCGAIGARFRITSAAGSGTTVEVTLVINKIDSTKAMV
jgi:PAS domain S-box-containing protein